MFKQLFKIIVGVVLFLLFCYFLAEDFADSCGQQGGTVTLSVEELKLLCVRGEVIGKFQLINLFT
jgi:hypothetical protein